LPYVIAVDSDGGVKVKDLPRVEVDVDRTDEGIESQIGVSDEGVK
jgi:hypothetical protein